ncbi:MAG: Sapep family Mn(2+)-dependent dipeptidase, partial [bacterium]
MHKKVDQRIEELKDNLIESTQEIIRIKSVRDKAVEEMPFGIGINDALERFIQIATAMGLKTRNLDGYAGYVEIGEGEELLGVLCHLDVVPEGSNWTYPPYNAEIVDGKIYGRGSIDNKGPALASLYALKALQDSEIKLNKRVRLILGTDEESDWQGIKYYLENEEIPDIAFTPDADFPVIHGEKGILHFKLAKEFKGNKENSNNPEENSKSKVKKKQIKFIEIKGGNAPNMVPDFCQALLESNSQEYIADEVYQYNDNNKSANLDINYQDEKIVIASHGVSAHGSLPEDGINAISHLLIFLGEIEFSEDINDFLKFYQQ